MYTTNSNTSLRPLNSLLLLDWLHHWIYSRVLSMCITRTSQEGTIVYHTIIASSVCTKEFQRLVPVCVLGIKPEVRWCEWVDCEQLVCMTRVVKLTVHYSRDTLMWVGSTLTGMANSELENSCSHNCFFLFCCFRDWRVPQQAVSEQRHLYQRRQQVWLPVLDGLHRTDVWNK